MRNRARPKGGNRRQPEKIETRKHGAETQMHNLIRDLQAFETFKETILPAIRKDLTNGFTAKQLREKYAALVQARQITTALSSEDAGLAASVSKDVIDRVDGRATEKKVVEHKFSELSNEELDAIIKSEQEDLADMESRFDQ